MPIDLTELAEPSHTAVITMEMQRGVIGDLALLPDLAGEAEARHIVVHTARLLEGARRRGVRVVHCTAEFRPDRGGSGLNAPLLVALSRGPAHLIAGSAAVELVPELGPHDGDLVSPRRHGVSPFSGTSLDITLRHLGVSTIVATGVSVNLGVLGLAIEAVNLGYRTVVATDAVCGYPPEYAEDVMRYTMALLATRTTVDALLAAWEVPG